jgi:hypothetical protein
VEDFEENAAINTAGIVSKRGNRTSEGRAEGNSRPF